MTDVALLLEVMFQWEVQEGPARARELHRGGESAVHDGDVTCRELTAQVVDVPDDLHAGDPGQGAWRDTWAGDDDGAQAGDAVRRALVGLDDAPQQALPGGRATGRRDADA